MVAIKPRAQARQVRDDLILRPDQFVAERGFGTAEPQSLVRAFHQRFPSLPPLRAYPEALIRNALAEKYPVNPRDLPLDDQRFLRYAFAHAVHRDKEWRIQERKTVAEIRDRLFVEDKLRSEHLWKMRFFRDVFKIMISREHGHHKARRIQEALFHALRLHTLKMRLHDRLETEHLIKAGFKRHAAFLAWRLDNLYLMTPNHSFVKVKGHGHMVEHVVGDLLWDLRRIITGRHHDWRRDGLYLPLANGGFAHAHHMGGQTFEHISEHIHLPQIHDRTDRAAKWHHGNSLVRTPNGGLLHMAGQGHIPEAAEALLNTPHIKEHERQDLLWHVTNLLQPLPNGGFAHVGPHQKGKAPELIEANIGWEDRRKGTAKHLDWRLSNLYSATQNGGFAPMRGHHGHSPEKITAQIANVGKVHVTTKFHDWHAANMAAPTPNHGFAPLKGHGQSVVTVSAHAALRPKQTRTAGFLLWHSTHRFRQTPNHGFAPIKNVGASFEQVTADFMHRNKDIITRRLAEHRFGALYTKGANGTWHRLAHVGKSQEHVAAQVAEPDEGRRPLANLPATDGHLQTSTVEQINTRDQQRIAQKKSLLAFQKTMAGHHQTASALHGHVRSPAPHHGRDVQSASNKPAPTQDVVPPTVAKGVKSA